MEKKTIIFGINDLVIGGAQRQLVRQLPLYDLEKFDIHIITLRDNSEGKNIIKEIPKEVSLYEIVFNGFLDISAWRDLFKTVKEINPNLVISSLFFSNSVFRILKIFLNYKIISREHNTYVNKKTYQILLDRVFALWTTKIVAVSEEVADFTSKQEKIDRNKFIVINNGINLEEIDKERLNLNKEETKKALSVKEDERVLISIGRLASQKNHVIMIKGFAEFCINHKNWKLFIVGSGTQEKMLKDLVRELKMEEHIIFEGEKSDTSPYYSVADALISTSDIEGMSNVQLKALAYGLPILATPTGGTSAIISEGKNGFIIEKSVPSCVSEVINKFASSDRELMKKNALDKRKEFDIKKTVQQYEKLFSKYVV